MKIELGEDKVPQIANPVKFSQSEINYSLTPPVLGSSTKQVLTDELSLNETELAHLKNDGVIG